MMSKVFIFVFALAILNVNAQTSGFSGYSDSAASGNIQTGGSIQTTVNVADVADPYKSHEDLKAKFAIYGKDKLKLTDGQITNAKMIVDELTALFKSTKALANPRLAAYLIATAYIDSNLIPSEEKLQQDTDKRAKQTAYFELGFQGRGYAHFTGAFNYNRFGKYLNRDYAAKPEKLLKPTHAARVLVYGAVNGKFTGFKASRFIPESGNADFLRARGAVNGDINADKIAKFTQEILA